MYKFPARLKSARILVTNDDGINANGIKVLERVARELCNDVWVCAPESERSGAGHSLTLHRPLRLRQISSKRYAVSGTPTDSVLLALHRILPNHPPDLVLSGVNRGGNVGEDITYSGTVAAAMEATLLGVPAIALSQYVGVGKRKVHWPTAETNAPLLIRKLCKTGWPKGVLININFPDLAVGEVKGVRVADQGQRRIGENLDRRIDPRGRPYYWIGTLRDDTSPRKGTDLDLIANGHISVTPVHLNLTHRPSIPGLRRALA